MVLIPHELTVSALSEAVGAAVLSEWWLGGLSLRPATLHGLQIWETTAQPSPG